MQKKKLYENIRPLAHELVRVKEMGNITELMFSERKNTSCKIKKISNEQYILLDTGEVKTFEHIENRADDKNSIRISLGKLRDLLNTNITYTSHCRWCTLTYAENMQDTKRLYKDFEKFIKRLRYLYGHFEYIVAMEPQGRGAWHCHVVLIFTEKAPYIPNKILSDVWGNGFVKVKKLDDVDNVGAYLTAYLGDMDLNDYIAEYGVVNKLELKEVDTEGENGELTKKYYVKGARLCMYPPNFNLYRCSRGIVKPKINYETANKAEKKISEDTLTFELTISLTDENKGFFNTLNYRYYNKARKQCQ